MLIATAHVRLSISALLSPTNCYIYIIYVKRIVIHDKEDHQKAHPLLQGVYQNLNTIFRL